jgi:hypothetical protein
VEVISLDFITRASPRKAEFVRIYRGFALPAALSFVRMLIDGGF